MNVSCLEEAITKSATLIEQVVNRFSDDYPFVEKCDLYGQAHLTVCQAWSDGKFELPYVHWHVTMRNLLVKDLRDYCEQEAQSHGAISKDDLPVNCEVLDIFARQALVDAMDGMPKLLRMCVALSYLEGWTQVDIAKLAGVSPAKVSDSIREGLCYMRRQYNTRQDLERYLRAYDAAK